MAGYRHCRLRAIEDWEVSAEFVHEHLAVYVLIAGPKPTMHTCHYPDQLNRFIQDRAGMDLGQVPSLSLPRLLRSPACSRQLGELAAILRVDVHLLTRVLEYI